MGIAANTIRGDPDQAQQFDGALSTRVWPQLWSMGLQYIHDLRADIQYRVESIHGTLEDDGEFTPTERTQLCGGHLEYIHRLCNRTCRGLGCRGLF